VISARDVRDKMKVTGLGAVAVRLSVGIRRQPEHEVPVAVVWLVNLSPLATPLA